MIVTYTPEGGEAHEWSFNPGKLLSPEAEAIERVTGWNYRTDFADKLLRGSALALRALIWVLLKRADPKLKFTDVEYAQDEADVNFDADERREIRRLAAEDPDMTDEDRAELLAALDDEDFADIAEAADEGKDAAAATD
ncbi:hypothetical protein [Angustibacter luteus]|uniref:Tail assembly chaperone n=1 Tax=Angustibacter luteus TaxID=658456 RepID=A0ABW1JIE4_9ACTN